MAKRQEKSPIKTVPRAKPPVKKSPQTQKVNVVKGNQNPRIRKQPHLVRNTLPVNFNTMIQTNWDHKIAY